MMGTSSPTARDLEAREGLPVGWALFEDGHPAEAGLGPFENQELKQFLVIMKRHAPFLVVIIDLDWGLGPTTAGSVWMSDV